VAVGDAGCLSLFGTQPAEHRLLAEHLTSEYFVETQGRGRTVQEWRIRPQHPDNHWLDCLVGSAVAASMQGCVLAGMPTPVPVRRRRVRPRVRPLST
jgi:hypothetical protein